MAYFATATQYAYGNDPSSDRLYHTIVNLFLTPRLPLTVLKNCGGEPEVLAFAGITIEMLVDSPTAKPTEERRHLFEDVLTGLGLTWPKLLALRFRPEFLKDSSRYPIIALYDKLDVRGEHFVDFYRTRAELKQCIAPTVAVALRFNWNYWP